MAQVPCMGPITHPHIIRPTTIPAIPVDTTLTRIAMIHGAAVRSMVLVTVQDGMVIRPSFTAHHLLVLRAYL